MSFRLPTLFLSWLCVKASDGKHAMFDLEHITGSALVTMAVMHWADEQFNRAAKQGIYYMPCIIKCGDLYDERQYSFTNGPARTLGVAHFEHFLNAIKAPLELDRPSPGSMCAGYIRCRARPNIDADVQVNLPDGQSVWLPPPRLVKA